jgi:K+ transporter
LAPFSGNAVLKRVSTDSNFFAVAPGGRTLPTVIVDACAAVAASSVKAAATTAARPSRLEL